MGLDKKKDGEQDEGTADKPKVEQAAKEEANDDKKEEDLPENDKIEGKVVEVIPSSTKNNTLLHLEENTEWSMPASQPAI